MSIIAEFKSFLTLETEYVVWVTIPIKPGQTYPLTTLIKELFQIINPSWSKMCRAAAGT